MDRNYAKLPLMAKEIDLILKAVPSVEAVMNTRHKVVKSKGWKDKAPTKAAFRAAALEENNLLRRPIVVHDGAAVIGRNLDAIRELLGR